MGRANYPLQMNQLEREMGATMDLPGHVRTGGTPDTFGQDSPQHEMSKENAVDHPLRLLRPRESGGESGVRDSIHAPA